MIPQPQLTSNQQWSIDFSNRQIQAGNLDLATDLEYRGCYISITPLHTRNSLYQVSAYAGDLNLIGTNKSSYKSAIELAKQAIDNYFYRVAA